MQASRRNSATPDGKDEPTMSMLYLVLALLFSLLIAVVAMVNNETVTVNYLLGRQTFP